jgi:hypothetical protein
MMVIRASADPWLQSVAVMGKNGDSGVGPGVGLTITTVHPELVL